MSLAKASWPHLWPKAPERVKITAADTKAFSHERTVCHSQHQIYIFGKSLDYMGVWCSVAVCFSSSVRFIWSPQVRVKSVFGYRNNVYLTEWASIIVTQVSCVAQQPLVLQLINKIVRAWFWPSVPHFDDKSIHVETCSLYFFGGVGDGSLQTDWRPNFCHTTWSQRLNQFNFE